ncbi:isochorismatase family protein [Polynucleobacter asymbioticus]|uniref:Isochorismatase n=1 Tax=Polynucleobacter asymbioticus TaxID=576611 RepID=A0AAC9IPS4_9BURK|nr:isochorismatase family protein [Polynucleobacter asymbioticus]APB98263.1 isochorismatase [Polynucleobacter asymbioticus]APC00549.1 isochorismatase [Polynucleobacter asymbioticus]
MFNQATSALILVDYQIRLLPSIHGGEAAVKAALMLAQAAALLEIPVIGTEQNPEGLGPNDERIRNCCNETVLKYSFNGVEDGLVASIQKINSSINQTVLAGCETHVCLMQTALGLKAKGFDVAVVAEACGSRSPNDKQLAIERMRDQGITILGIEMIIFEWLTTSNHPQFKNILQLIKNREVKN